MLKKLWKALATFAVLVLLYVRGSPISEYSLPKIPWVIIFVLTLTYGISLLFSSKVAPYRRFASAYLVFTGFFYLLVGFWGLLPNWDLIEASAWSSLISPYLLLSFLGQLTQRFPYTAAKAPYEIVPESQHHGFSGLVVAVSAIAIFAAFGMAKERKVAYAIWLAILILLGVSCLGYVIVGFVSWGAKETVLPLCWLASYVAAYMVARKGVIFQPSGATSVHALKG